VHLWLLAQSGVTDATSLGPFAAFGTLAVGVIGWLVKALSDARADAKETRADNKVLVDRVFTLAENSGPILARTVDALDRNTRVLDQDRPR
jgi:hypothetical protein